MSNVPGPYDDAIAAIGVQINALTADLKALRDGHAAKADLEAIRVELTEARTELKALKDKAKEKPAAKVVGPLVSDDGACPVSPEDIACGYW